MDGQPSVPKLYRYYRPLIYRTDAKTEQRISHSISGTKN
uniref:Uncharacterized protein n=1 Tax=Arundo donax TaxID=35708 RepID=A0A0A9BKR7_ARUDO